jgi:hypothetical protein
MSAFYCRSFVLVLLSFSLVMCQNEDDANPQATDCLMEEIIQTPYWISDDYSYPDLPADTFVHIIENGLITQRLLNNKPFEEFIYDDNGLLIAISRYNPGFGTWSIIDSFFYENNRLITTRRRQADGLISRELSFFWNQDTLTSAYSTSYLVVNGERTRQDNHYQYTYTDGNISELIRTFYSADGDSLKTKEFFQFDSNPNLINNLSFLPLRFIFDFNLPKAPHWFSVNNVTKSTRYTIDDHWTGETNYSYTWEDDKVVQFTSSSQTNTSLDVFVRPVEIEYYCE